MTTLESTTYYICWHDAQGNDVRLQIIVNPSNICVGAAWPQVINPPSWDLRLFLGHNMSQIQNYCAMKGWYIEDNVDSDPEVSPAIKRATTENHKRE